MNGRLGERGYRPATAILSYRSAQKLPHHEIYNRYGSAPCYGFFFPPTFTGFLPLVKSAVAATFSFLFLGFFVSLLPRLLLPLDITLPFEIRCILSSVNGYFDLPGFITTAGQSLRQR